MVYERLSKWFINGYPNSLSANPSGLLTIFLANHQHSFKWIISYNQVENRPLSKWCMNGYPNSLSATIHVNY